jgi:hypothetical protein
VRGFAVVNHIEIGAVAEQVRTANQIVSIRTRRKLLI